MPSVISKKELANFCKSKLLVLDLYRPMMSTKGFLIILRVYGIQTTVSMAEIAHSQRLLRVRGVSRV